MDLLMTLILCCAVGLIATWLYRRAVWHFYAKPKIERANVVIAHCNAKIAELDEKIANAVIDG
jgi:hypothetical protein